MMGIKVERQKEKIALIAILLAGSCFLTYYFHVVLQTGTVFTHLFYIPIILASLWWKRKGLAVAIFLAVFLLFSHHFLIDYVETANDYLRALMFVIIGFVVATLSQRIAKAQEKTAHLNAILHAIRNVSQLITREKDRDSLLQGICDNLIETRGYHNAWIALLDKSGGLVTTAESGLGKDFLPLVDRLKHGELTECGQKALKQSNVVVTKDPLSSCADCPLSPTYGGKGAMAVQLEYDGKVYGLLSASIPSFLTTEEEEQSLFKEIAVDIVFALHSIELEEERKQTEEALRETRNYLEKLVNHANAPIIVWDPESKITRFNHAFEHMTGLTADEVIGKELRILFPEASRDNSLKKISSTLSDEYWESVEIPILCKDGDIRIALWNSANIYAEDGTTVIATIAQGQDISELKRSEEALKDYSERLEEMVEERTKELKETQEELVRKEKLAVLGQLASGVGHELRNPLGVISNAIYYLKTILPDADETTKEYLDLINSEVYNSNKIALDLLDFSRTRPAEREEIVVSELVAKTLEKSQLPENVKVTTRTASDLPPVFIDPLQIGQVLANLVTNAYQAMPEGGRLIIDAKADKGQIYLSISDTGYGISKENMKKLFEPLFTTRARGIGLGLAVSKNLLR